MIMLGTFTKQTLNFILAAVRVVLSPN